MANKLHAFDAVLNNIEAATERDAYRDQLFPFLFSHSLIGYHHGRSARWFLKLAISVTVILLPLLLLAAAQTRFLPYHSEPITWSHRTAVVLDVVLLWTLWPMIVTQRGYTRAWWRQASTAPLRWFPARMVIRLLAWERLPQPLQAIAAWGCRAQVQRASGLTFLAMTTSALLVYALTIAVIPGKPTDNRLAGALFDPPNNQDRPRPFFHRNLYLAEGVFVAGELSSEMAAVLRSNDEKEQAEVRKKILGINLAGRDLRFADFPHAILPKADLRNAQLQGTNLISTQLQGANLWSAQLQDADLRGAQLQDAVLALTQLQGTILADAQLQGANLLYAQLQGANLSPVQLQGADLQGANLQLSDLHGVRIEVLSQTDYDIWKTTLPEERQIEAAKRVGQPTSIEKAEIQDAWCDDILHSKVKGCLPAGDRSTYEKKLAEFLTELSCNNAYTARGIRRHRLSSLSPSQFERNLAAALLDKSELPDCKGLRALSQDGKDRLRRLVKEYDEKAGEQQEKEHVENEEAEPRP